MYRGDLGEVTDVATLDRSLSCGCARAFLNARQLPSTEFLSFLESRPTLDSWSTPIMDRGSLLAKVDSRASLDFLSRMAQHKSYSETEGERQLARFMAEQMGAIGLKAELTPVEGQRVNAIGRWHGTGGGRSLLFNGHVDTNPVTEGWTVDPWGGLVDDKFIYGIGVSNMEAGDAPTSVPSRR